MRLTRRRSRLGRSISVQELEEILTEHGWVLKDPIVPNPPRPDWPKEPTTHEAEAERDLMAYVHGVPYTGGA